MPQAGSTATDTAPQQQPETPQFRQIEVQFIAANVDPTQGTGFMASKGTGAETWGIWRLDPGPRGVYLQDYKQLEASGGKGPDGWQFDNKDWWIEEHGLIMPKRDFPIPPGKYVVTGGRETTTVLTIHEDGSWELGNPGPVCTLHDITHLPCRTGQYNPTSTDISPLKAKLSDFPVTPGGPMPTVEGCTKKDWSVIFIVGEEVKPKL